MKYFKTVIFICLIISINSYSQEMKSIGLLSEIDLKEEYNFESFVVKEITKATLYASFKTVDKKGYEKLNNLFKKELGIPVSDLEEKHIDDTISIKQKRVYKLLNTNNSELYYSGEDIKDKVFEIKVDDKPIIFLNSFGGIFLKDIEEITIKDLNDLAKKNKNIYNCDKGEAIGDLVLQDNLNAIKSVVLFGSNDEANSNSAISFTKEGELTKLNVGFNLKIKNKHYFNINVNSSQEEGYIFDSDGWRDEIGLGLTWNYFMKSSQYFNTKDCELLDKKRESYITKTLEENIKYAFLNVENLKTQIKEIDKAKKLSGENVSYKDYKNNIELDSLKVTLEKQLKEAKEILKDPSKYYDKETLQFEKDNDILKGYFLRRFAFTGKIENQTLSIDSLGVLGNKDIITNIPKLTFSGALKVDKKTVNNRVLNAQAFFNINMSSFLESIQKDRTPFLQNVDNETFVYDNVGNKLGRYQDLKRAYWTMDLGTDASWYLLNEYIGFTALFNHKFALQTLEYVNFKNRYSAQVGLIFRMQNEKDINKATFRILAGAEDLLYSQKTFKNASIKISLGIPFNIFTKS